MPGNKLYIIMSGTDKLIKIPVYQRNYDWTKKQCKQLLDDLLTNIEENRSRRQEDAPINYFFGSIVILSDTRNDNEYIIIDGQQRITSISLLFLAIRNLLKDNVLRSTKANQAEIIWRTYIKDEDNNRLRLKQDNNDRNAYEELLINQTENHPNSNIVSNYVYFKNQLQKLSQNYSADDFIDAIKRLEVVQIDISYSDRPQLIFESLNATGLDLSEADKIRNFILMGLQTETQTEYHNDYWIKIERNTKEKISDFFRFYLESKENRFVKEADVYFRFKKFVKAQGNNINEVYKQILEEITTYSNIYKNIIESNFENESIRNIIKRLKLLDLTVMYPFLFTLFWKMKQNEINEDDVTKTLECIESYLFRRYICNVPTNALNKMFCSLSSDIEKERINNTNVSYSSLCIHTLQNYILNKRFPKDDEFKKSIAEEDCYNKKSDIRKYMFDRLESCYEHREALNIIERMNDDKNPLTIEHIMPQELTDEWKKHLGNDWQTVYNEKLNTLANLTLTAYNSAMSNEPFVKKKKTYAESKVSLTRDVAQYDKWTLEQMNQRLKKLSEFCFKCWPYPQSGINAPEDNQVKELSLDQLEDATYYSVIGYQFDGEKTENPKDWRQCLINIAKTLYEEDYIPMQRLAADTQNSKILNEQREGYSPIDEDVKIYIEINSDTNSKIKLIKRLFEAYGKDEEDLKFYIQRSTAKKKQKKTQKTDNQ